ncbi:MAG: SDR family oxidoreductase [Chloroflexota bacterium]
MVTKVVLITGAAGGIGSEAAKRLASMGFELVLVDINQNGLMELSASLPQPATCIAANLLFAEEIERVHTEVINRFGRLDILINNVGIVINGPYEERPFELIDREMQLNFNAPARLIRLFAQNMKEQESGHIISVSSLAGITPLKECPVYSASKFALRGLMLSLNMSLKEHGINVTNICPSAVDTPMLEEEVRTGGSKLNFLADPQPPSAIVDAIVKAIKYPDTIEICVPGSDGFLSKLAGSFPKLNVRLTPLVERMATKTHKRYLESKGIAVEDS